MLSYDFKEFYKISENDIFNFSEAEMFEDIKGLVKAYRYVINKAEIDEELIKEYESIIERIEELLQKQTPSLSSGQCEYINSSKIRIGAWQGDCHVEKNLTDDEKSEIIDNICQGKLKGDNYYCKIKILLHNPNQKTLFRNLSIPAKQKIAEDIVNNKYCYGAFLEVSNEATS